MSVRPAPPGRGVLSSKWQARRESNPQPAVLETAALPIELLAYSVVVPTWQGDVSIDGCRVVTVVLPMTRSL
jgi:hypothetical protein